MVTAQDIADAANTIRAGGLVAFPTETVYGLAANALDATAVAQVFELKCRPQFDPLISHIADASQLTKLAREVPAQALELIEHFWPGPLSLVLKKQPQVPDIVTAGLSSFAIRCPDHEIARKLIRSAGVPLAAPSANRFGMISPTTATHVIEQFGDQLPIVLDDGPCRIGVESTVVSFVDSQDGRPMLLRPGGVTLEKLEEIIGPIEVPTLVSSRPTSPGQLSRHYSPATPLILSADSEKIVSANDKLKVGLMSFQRPHFTAGFAAIEVLSEQGCLREAAVNLFAAMRRLDALGLDIIVAQPVPEVELGRAIMDRLRRAAVS
ncbi:L-threonylcarbamoyladenylate synthase [Bythopirellula polymerisocia]|jgi:L-threonylcarbamoyladenylate synthase|uniref:Threonylcarbamoyl-AMP synthase n=1 Tax=Bythopirellula polymerisocia TaxID=2528003 RepID=A0A5C6CQW4_9BACT|nr:L-threonylcarbamoyladenylate synthase [Bythopirellula polymerisocia]TWU25944.1 Threonylcarbamoyl-AMP synthase [Bythopirellula polymerisocia]